jgi:hypothetical protein
MQQRQRRKKVQQVGAPSPAKVLDRIGEPGQSIDRRLREFTASAKLLASEQLGLAARCRNKWVGVHKGEVAAAADTLEQLMHRLAP